MKLRRIEIENFRGFSTSIEVEIDDFTAFIGRNDIGKSSIFAALNIFLEGEGTKIDQDDGCIYGNPSKVRISCEFDTLPDKIILDDQFETNLEQEHLLRENGRLRISKIYDCSKSKITPDIYIDTENHPVDIDGNSLLPLTLQELKRKAKEAAVDLEPGEATVKAKIRRAIVDRSGTIKYTAVSIPIGKNEAKTVWDQLLKYLPMCALFVSDRASTEKDKEAQTPMGIAVEAALSEIQGDLDKITEHVERRIQDVADRTLEKLREMNPSLASELTATLREKPKWKDIFKYSLNSNEGIPLDKRGSGVRRMVLLSFFRAEAERRALGDGGRPIIYAIEEPETSQHPDHQKMMISALLEIASKGGQVLLTTHSPGLAREMPIDSLRFIDDECGAKSVRCTNNEGSHDLFMSLAERLGMLPDNNVRVLVCVEGKNDVRFLKHVSHTLNSSDTSILDLSSDPRFVFIPMNGSNLRDIVNLYIFKNFKKPEFHLYDHDGTGTYAAQISEVNSRGDGSIALQTKKRYMESYIHAEAIRRVKEVTIAVNDTDDYVEKLCSYLRVKKPEAKAILAAEVAPQMTVFEIDDRDGQKEIRSWLKTLAEMANSSNGFSPKWNGGY
ncbi:ATP-binding protein [Methanosarcina sp.]|uniref:ATP-binding protein n=1 Tax=Methanosarcina sp. TaxID=2213 RepID=UPI002ABB0432|nr:ATP-binding protein [Methanosarcina sp.]MDY9926896.1 ATP-binding protein [Methanosarcina sp.]